MNSVPCSGDSGGVAGDTDADNTDEEETPPGPVDFLHNPTSSVLLGGPCEVTLLGPDGSRRTARIRCRPGTGKRILARLDGLEARPGPWTLRPGPLRPRALRGRDGVARSGFLGPRAGRAPGVQDRPARVERQVHAAIRLRPALLRELVQALGGNPLPASDACLALTEKMVAGMPRMVMGVTAADDAQLAIRGIWEASPAVASRGSHR